MEADERKKIVVCFSNLVGAKKIEREDGMMRGRTNGMGSIKVGCVTSIDF